MGGGGQRREGREGKRTFPLSFSSRFLPFLPLPRLRLLRKLANLCLLCYMFASLSETWQTILSRPFEEKLFLLTTGNCRQCELSDQARGKQIVSYLKHTSKSSNPYFKTHYCYRNYIFLEKEKIRAGCIEAIITRSKSRKYGTGKITLNHSDWLSSCT